MDSAGFNRREAADFVAAARPEQGLNPLTAPIPLPPLPEPPDLNRLPRPVRAKLAWDELLQTLTIAQPLTSAEEECVKQAVASEPACQQIAQAAAASCAQAVEFFRTPAEQGLPLAVPQLALRVPGELALFDDPEVRYEESWTMPDTVVIRAESTHRYVAQPLGIPEVQMVAATEAEAIA